jgi:hypothetical protein
MRLERGIAFLAIMAATAVTGWGCGSTPLPAIEIEEGPTAEITADGLHRARKVGYDNVWLKPDVDFERYVKLMLDPVQVAYKRTPKASYARNMTDRNFALSDRQMANLKRWFREEFEKELGKLDQFTLVDEPGPDVLRIEAALLDLVVNVPTRQRAGREFVFTTSTAQMTLVMELRDSPSSEILARIAERREARNAGSGINDLYWSTGPTNVGAVKSTFRRWARILTRRLAEVHALPPAKPAS